MRNTKQYDLKWFYEYFLENKGKRVDMDTFGQLFNMLDLNTTLSFIDAKFSLTRLEDKNGNLIKIIE